MENRRALSGNLELIIAQFSNKKIQTFVGNKIMKTSQAAFNFPRLLANFNQQFIRSYSLNVSKNILLTALTF